MVSRTLKKASPVVTSLVLTNFFSCSALALVLVSEPKMQLQPRVEYSGTVQGCYSTAGGNMQVAGTSIYQTSGKCGKICADLDKPVMALQDDQCLCGDLKPSAGSKLPLSACSTVCPGYDVEDCGGSGAYTVWLTGVDDSVGSVGSSDASHDQTSSSTGMPWAPSSSMYSSNPTTSTKQSPSTRTHEHSQPSHKPSHKAKPKPSHKSKSSTTETKTTVVKTVISHPSASNKPQAQTSSSNSPTGSTIGIAVGVVGGIVCLAAVIAGILFYLRRRRRMKNAENGHRRADSLNAFVAAGGHLPASSPSKIPVVTVNDNRLDPRIMQETRRASAGSFLADNQDYSRRILKVTNPDGT